MNSPAVQTHAASEPHHFNRDRRPLPVAVIDIGTSSVRMAIAEITADGSVQPLETLSQGLALGKDTFTQGSIDKRTIEECVRVLKAYRQKLEEYGIRDPRQIRVVATSAVREAVNRLAFIDRVYVATGFAVDSIDEAEVHRITYRGIQPIFKAVPELANSDLLITEVGGGSTELLLVQQGEVAFSHSFRLGSLRLRASLQTMRGSRRKMRELMEVQIGRTLANLPDQMHLDGPCQLVALGGDMRLALRTLVGQSDPATLGRISTEQLRGFCSEMLRLTEDEIVRRYRITYPEAETVGPALLVYTALADLFQLDHVLVTQVNLRDGMLTEMASADVWTEDFRTQIIRSAIELGRRFHFDEAHARHVARLCTVLFRALAKEHRLDDRYELILYLAALLHEIGAYVNTSSMHKHSMYLITNSELFGLGRHDMLLIGLVARYHRRASPKPAHSGYSTLERDERVAVSKLAAILRVADALDASRSQRITDITCKSEGNRLIVSVPNLDDVSVEQLTLKQNGTLFEEIYGLRVLLRATG